MSASSGELSRIEKTVEPLPGDCEASFALPPADSAQQSAGYSSIEVVGSSQAASEPPESVSISESSNVPAQSGAQPLNAVKVAADSNSMEVTVSKSIDLVKEANGGAVGTSSATPPASAVSLGSMSGQSKVVAGTSGPSAGLLNLTTVPAPAIVPGQRTIVTGYQTPRPGPQSGALLGTMVRAQMPPSIQSPASAMSVTYAGTPMSQIRKSTAPNLVRSTMSGQARTTVNTAPVPMPAHQDNKSIRPPSGAGTVQITIQPQRNNLTIHQSSSAQPGGLKPTITLQTQSKPNQHPVGSQSKTTAHGLLPTAMGQPGTKVTMSRNIMQPQAKHNKIALQTTGKLVQQQGLVMPGPRPIPTSMDDPGSNGSGKLKVTAAGYAVPSGSSFGVGPPTAASRINMQPHTTNSAMKIPRNPTLPQSQKIVVAHSLPTHSQSTEIASSQSKLHPVNIKPNPGSTVSVTQPLPLTKVNPQKSTDMSNDVKDARIMLTGNSAVNDAKAESKKLQFGITAPLNLDPSRYGLASTVVKSYVTSNTGATIVNSGGGSRTLLVNVDSAMQKGTISLPQTSVEYAAPGDGIGQAPLTPTRQGGVSSANYGVGGSPRPTILRKRTFDTSNMVVKRNLNKSLSVDSQHSVDSLAKGESPANDFLSRDSSRSSTESATSTPERMLEESRILMFKQEPMEAMGNGPLLDAQNTFNSDMVSPRKKPRKQYFVMKTTDSSEEQQFGEETEVNNVEKEGDPSPSLPPPQENPSQYPPMCAPSSPMPELDDETVKRLSEFEFVDKNGVRWIKQRERPQCGSLGKEFELPYKLRENHFERHSDVKVKEKTLTVSDIASDKLIQKRISGWRVCRVTAQLIDLHDSQNEWYHKLQSVRDSLSKLKSTNEDTRGLNELVQASLLRMKSLQDQLKEAERSILKVFDHQRPVTELIMKHKSKRSVKKKERP